MRLISLGGALLALLSCLFALGALVAHALPAVPRPVPADLREAWRPDLAQVRTLEEAERLLPAYIARERGSREQRTAAAIDRFVRERFFHGTSELAYRENWLAVVAGIIWLDLRVPVLPEEILQHRRAMCSQQAIVFMELLRRSGIEYASVLMSWPSPDRRSRGHFAVAARVDGRWLYFDPDQEVAQIGVPLESVIDGSALPALYGHRPALLASLREAAARGRIRMAHVDAFPAPRGGLFQKATRWLSAYGWMLFAALGLACALSRARFRRTPRLAPA